MWFNRIGGEEIRVACARRPGAPKLMHGLRHVEIDHDALAEPCIVVSGTARQRRLGGQRTEDAVDQACRRPRA